MLEDLLLSIKQLSTKVSFQSLLPLVITCSLCTEAVSLMLNPIVQPASTTPSLWSAMVPRAERTTGSLETPGVLHGATKATSSSLLSTITEVFAAASSTPNSSPPSDYDFIQYDTNIQKS